LQVFAPVPVVALPVPEQVLHLRCLITLWYDNHVFMPDTPAGRQLWSLLCAVTTDYEVVWIDSQVAANVLSMPFCKVMLVQNVHEPSLKKLQLLGQERGWTVIPMDMSETIKADGALTCQSVLFGQ
jgi:dimethylargininase